MVFAVIRTGGKQYVARPGEKLEIEKLDAPEKGSHVTFSEVLLYADGERVEIGRPLVAGASVTAEHLGTQKDDKVIVFKYHSKTRLRKKRGHRQPHTTVLVKEIVLK
ncbi:MAG: 50S ribosomal protein L21 [Candidatus Niyogibacteria bacterium]|nr:50S ribosomal protein L21 [Candidatus Niyogibacteria bacterium]